MLASSTQTSVTNISLQAYTELILKPSINLPPLGSSLSLKIDSASAETDLYWRINSSINLLFDR